MPSLFRVKFRICNRSFAKAKIIVAIQLMTANVLIRTLFSIDDIEALMVTQNAIMEHTRSIENTISIISPIVNIFIYLI